MVIGTNAGLALAVGAFVLGELGITPADVTTWLEVVGAALVAYGVGNRVK